LSHNNSGDHRCGQPDHGHGRAKPVTYTH